MARIRRKAPPEHRGRGISDWRTDRLREAGFSRPLADRVASDGRYDLHALLELIDRGCSPELAARILAPLDEHDSR